MSVVTVILDRMETQRDVSLTHDDVDDVNPAIATRILLPHDADPSTSDASEIPLERFVGRGIVVRAVGVEAREFITYSFIAAQI